MNAELLLKHFDRISDAPDAVLRLRKFILDLAIRGKLVEPDPADESAANLLERIRREKTRVAQLTGKKEKPIQALPESDSFEIPAHWRWTQLAEVGFINPRNAAPDELLASFVPMNMISAEYGIANRHEVRPWGEIKSGFTHFAEGDVGLAKITPCFENGKSSTFRNLTGDLGAGTTELHIVRPVLLAGDYIGIFLKSPHFIDTGIPKMTGTAGQKRVPTDYFAYSPFPLPPLAEQHRIVAKVDELMALCDRLEEARKEREARRDRLTAASLHHLNNAAPGEDLRKHARFFINHLPKLTARPDQIPILRPSLLNLAVRGQLNTQGSLDEFPAAVLKRLGSLLPRTRRRTAPHDAQVASDETTLDFSLPPQWISTTIGEICSLVTSGSRGWAEFYSDDGPAFVRAQNIRFGRLLLQDLARVNPPSKSEGSRTQVLPGDLLMVITGAGVTNPALLEHSLGEAYVSQHVALIRPGIEGISRWLLLCLMAPVGGRAQLVECAYGAGKPGLNLDQIRGIRIPFPPLEEQSRILARVEHLMQYCDSVEGQIANTAALNHRLLDSVLTSALNRNE